MSKAIVHRSRKGERVVPDVMLWVTKPEDKDVPSLEAVGQEVRRLNHVSEVDVRPEGSVMGVLFEGGRAEQEEIEHTIREAGYDIFKVSHRET
jgi:hypothetical protein